jgi:acyl-CoA synthetase (NDP forming)
MNVLNPRKIDSSYWRALFAADSIAVIGAKDIPGSWGYDALKAMSESKQHGVERSIYAVNPNCGEVLGYSCYNTVLDIPGPVELVIIVVPAPIVPSVFRQCARKKVKSAVIISAGFGEVDEAGARLEAELVEIAREGRIHFVGPNCVGHADMHTHLASAAMASRSIAGPMAILSQSGTLGANMMQMATTRGVGISKFVSTGNETDMHFEDYLEFLAGDKDTKIIAAYIEGLREGRRFYELAKKITLEKPIIAIKTGSTGESGKAAKSHTGALSGADEIYSAAFKQSGVIRADDEEEICGMATAIMTQPLPRGNRVGILTMGGGFGVVTAEACEQEGLSIATLEHRTIERINEILPSRWSHGNPVDLVGVRPMGGDPTVISCLKLMLEDDNVDIIMTLLPPGVTSHGPIEDFSPEKIRELQKENQRSLENVARELKKYGKPVYLVSRFAFQQETRVFPSRTNDRIPEYSHHRRAAGILKKLAWYRQYLDGRKA